MDLNRHGFFPLCGGNVFGVIPGFLKGEHLRPVTLVERDMSSGYEGYVIFTICYIIYITYHLYSRGGA